MAKYGFSALNQNLNPNNNNGFAVSQALSQANLIQAVRVLSIVLDESHPRFKELGEWNGLGIIEYETINNPVASSTPLPYTRPLLSNQKSFEIYSKYNTKPFSKFSALDKNNKTEKAIYQKYINPSCFFISCFYIFLASFSINNNLQVI